MKNQKMWWLAIVFAVIVAVVLTIVNLPCWKLTNKEIACLCLLGTISGLVSLVLLFVIGWRKEIEAKKQLGPKYSFWKVTWLLLTSLLIVTTTLAVPISATESSMIGASNAPISAVNYYNDAGFELASYNDDCILTPIAGGPIISFPANSVYVDKGKNLIVTPAGTFTVIKTSSGGILFKGSNGTVYKPNITLCELLVAVVIVSLLVPVVIQGCKAYRCITNTIAQYTNSVGSNLNDVVISTIRPTIGANKNYSKMNALPSLPMDTAGATFTTGPVTNVLGLPEGSSMCLTNMQSNEYIGNVDPCSVDVFGNPVYEEFLWEIDPTNSFLVTADGQCHPCCAQTSTNLANWSDCTMVALIWLGMNADGTVGSETIVSMTGKEQGLQSYATNWVKFPTIDNHVTIFRSLNGQYPIAGANSVFLRFGRPMSSVVRDQEK